MVSDKNIFMGISHLSHQDGCGSAVALLLKAALIQVSDYRLLGASGLAHLGIAITWHPSSVR
jgi:hypothetical protein